MPLPDPVPALKAQLAAEINAITGRELNFMAARRLGVGWARVSDLRHGRHERFSVERLIRMLARADCRVTLEVHALPRVTRARSTSEPSRR